MASLMIKNDPEHFKIKTKDDAIEDLICKTEKQDYENLMKTLKINGAYYKKKYEKLNKRKHL